MTPRDGIPWSEVSGVEVCSSYFERHGIHVMTERSQYDPHPWSARTVADTWGVVLVRSGAYARRSNADERVVDAATGLIRRPGDEIAYRHFLRSADEVTIVNIAPEALDLVPGLVNADGAFHVTPELDLAHRLLIRALEAAQCAGRSPHEHEEAVIDLLHQVVQSEPRRPVRARRSSDLARGRLIQDACELLHADHDTRLSVVEIGRRIGCSPYHLSRTFHRVTGTTISKYRQRLRVHAALDRITGGDEDLSMIAASTGFSDHPHMTRCIAADVGHVPSELRRIFRRGASVAS